MTIHSGCAAGKSKSAPYVLKFSAAAFTDNVMTWWPPRSSPNYSESNPQNREQIHVNHSIANITGTVRSSLERRAPSSVNHRDRASRVSDDTRRSAGAERTFSIVCWSARRFLTYSASSSIRHVSSVSLRACVSYFWRGVQQADPQLRLDVVLSHPIVRVLKPFGSPAKSLAAPDYRK